MIKAWDMLLLKVVNEIAFNSTKDYESRLYLHLFCNRQILGINYYLPEVLICFEPRKLT